MWKPKLFVLLRAGMIFAAMGSRMIAQAPDQNPTLQLRVEGPRGGRPIPVEKQAGDSVILDESTLDIVATSNGETYRFRPQNLTRPIVSFALKQDSGQVDYVYEFFNQAGAEHFIGGFAVEISDPSEPIAAAPEGWSTLRVEVDGIEPAVFFLHVTRDDEVFKKITSGKRAGPFRLVSERLPGLTRARFTGGSLERADPGTTDGERLERLSPWARQRVLDLSTSDRGFQYRWVVAPTARPTEDSLDRVRAEFTLALQLPELGAIHQRLQTAVTAGRLDDASAAVEMARAESVVGTLPYAFSEGLLLRIQNLKSRGVR